MRAIDQPLPQWPDQTEEAGSSTVFQPSDLSFVAAALSVIPCDVQDCQSAVISSGREVV
jgi:hypothetical protein